jgi:hypothetical protein
MLKRRSASRPSFGADGRRMEGSTPSTISCPKSCGSNTLGLGGGGRRTNPSITNGHSSNKLFSSGRILQVVRAPIMNGLTCGLASVLQPFRRPKEKRRGQQKRDDEALKTSSLGMKKRLDGMQRILERQGKGIHFTGAKRDESKNGDGSTCGETSEEEEEDRPFEPLRLWMSPHQGGEPVGLPTRM